MAGIEAVRLTTCRLPGRYDGANAIQRAFRDFELGRASSTGCMIHEVILAVDQGTPLVTEEVPIKEGDTLESLEDRIHVSDQLYTSGGIRASLPSMQVSESNMHAIFRPSSMRLLSKGRRLRSTKSRYLDFDLHTVDMQPYHKRNIVDQLTRPFCHCCPHFRQMTKGGFVD